MISKRARSTSNPDKGHQRHHYRNQNQPARALDHEEPTDYCAKRRIDPAIQIRPEPLVLQDAVVLLIRHTAIVRGPSVDGKSG